MESEYVGDAPDYWKGRMFSLLSNHLRSLHIAPLTTRPDTWKDAHKAAYRRILGIEDENRVIGFESSYTGDVRSINASIEGDIFLDPNTGLREEPASHKKRKNYVYVQNLCDSQLLEQNRIVLVYDESRNHQYEKDEHINEIGEYFSERQIDWFGYDSGKNLTMFFLSKKVGFERLGSVHRWFSDHANVGRVHASSTLPSAK